jgi:hypothetical protein
VLSRRFPSSALYADYLKDMPTRGLLKVWIRNPEYSYTS